MGVERFYGVVCNWEVVWDCMTGSTILMLFFFFSSRRRHTRFDCDWSSDVCSSDLYQLAHHCTARYRANVITGSVQIASVVHPRWKEGKNDRTDPVGWPVCW